MHIPHLTFTEGGWCEALGRSYAPGVYHPKTVDEYNALAPFAVDAEPLKASDDTAPKGPKPLEEMKAGELIAYAAAEKLNIGDMKPQAGQEKILAAVQEAIAKKAPEGEA